MRPRAAALSSQAGAGPSTKRRPEKRSFEPEAPLQLSADAESKSGNAGRLHQAAEVEEQELVGAEKLLTRA